MALATVLQEMERAAVSSEGTRGRPPVSRLERVRTNSATWYLRQILPKMGMPMRMWSKASRAGLGEQEAPEGEGGDDQRGHQSK